jgi:hypothetical protein
VPRRCIVGFLALRCYLERAYAKGYSPQIRRIRLESFRSRIVFPLRQDCAEQEIAYDNKRILVALDKFLTYGMSFQERLVPELERRQVLVIARDSGIFRVRLKAMESFARRLSFR